MMTDVLAPVCPDCGSHETRSSRKKGLVVKIFKFFKFARFKGLTCGKRFYVPA